MAKLDKKTDDKGFENTLKPRKRGFTRRDFFKITAAAGAGGGVASMLDWAIVGSKVAGYTVGATGTSVCPYCAVGCNVVWATGTGSASGQVVDIYGDTVCPINRGGLCSKGAASLQLVNNTQRVGVSGSIHTASAPPNEGPMKRTGSGAWAAITWDTALTEIASATVAARETVPVSGGKVTGTAHGVAFLGCANGTNEENWLYRKLATEFGTNDIEHQARI